MSDGAGFWESVREQRTLFFDRANRCGDCRLNRPRRRCRCPGTQLIEWGGALRWLAADDEGEAVQIAVRTAASSAGGHATLFRHAGVFVSGISSACAGNDEYHPPPEGKIRSRRGYSILAGCIRNYKMQTSLADFIKDSPEGQEADAILRSCVHCGFCLAICPTYQLLGDELDSPRGRIYLMKQVMEGAPVTEKTQLHLDRCLTCRACETVCPSGVRYGRLVDIGRGIVEKKVGRRLAAGTMRYALRQTLARPGVFAALLKLGRTARPLLPGALKNSIALLKHEAPFGESLDRWPPVRHHTQNAGARGLRPAVPGAQY